MANERWPVLTPAGGDVLPVANATLYTGEMSASSAPHRLDLSLPKMP